MERYTPQETAEIIRRFNDTVARGIPVSSELAKEMRDATIGIKNFSDTLTFNSKNLKEAVFNAANRMSEGAEGLEVFSDIMDKAGVSFDSMFRIFPSAGNMLGKAANATGKLIAASLKQGDALFKNYQSMSRSGLVVGMDSTFKNLQAAGYTVSEIGNFTTLMKTNANTLALLGGTAADGMNKITDVSKSINSSGLIEEFGNMGLSVEDVNVGILEYTKFQQLTGSSKIKSTREMRDGAKAYIEQQDRLTKLTGINAAEQNKAYEKALRMEQFNYTQNQLKQQADAGDKDAAAKLKRNEEMIKIFASPELAPMSDSIAMLLSGAVNDPNYIKAVRSLPNVAKMLEKGETDTGKIMNQAAQDARNTVAGNIDSAKVGIFEKNFGDFGATVALANTVIKDNTKELEKTKKEQEDQKSGKHDNWFFKSKTSDMTKIKQSNRDIAKSFDHVINEGLGPATSAVKLMSTAAAEAANFIALGKKGQQGGTMFGGLFGNSGTGRRTEGFADGGLVGGTGNSKEFGGRSAFSQVAQAGMVNSKEYAELVRNGFESVTKPINKTELMKRGLANDTPTQLQTAAKKIGIKVNKSSYTYDPSQDYLGNKNSKYKEGDFRKTADDLGVKKPANLYGTGGFSLGGYADGGLVGHDFAGSGKINELNKNTFETNKPINKTELMKRGLANDTPTQLQTVAKKVGIKVNKDSTLGKLSIHDQVKTGIGSNNRSKDNSLFKTVVNTLISPYMPLGLGLSGNNEKNEVDYLGSKKFKGTDFSSSGLPVKDIKNPYGTGGYAIGGYVDGPSSKKSSGLGTTSIVSNKTDKSIENLTVLLDKATESQKDYTNASEKFVKNQQTMLFLSENSATKDKEEIGTDQKTIGNTVDSSVKKGIVPVEKSFKTFSDLLSSGSLSIKIKENIKDKVKEVTALIAKGASLATRGPPPATPQLVGGTLTGSSGGTSGGSSGGAPGGTSGGAPGGTSGGAPGGTSGGTSGGTPSGSSGPSIGNAANAATLNASGAGSVAGGTAETEKAGGLAEGTGPTTVGQNQQLFQQAMTDLGVTDPKIRASMAAAAEGESGFKMQTEIGYQNTSNENIRKSFGAGSIFGKMPDDELTKLKADPVKFFDYVYGDKNPAFKGYGNDQPGDGYKYRGRGFIGITFKTNYKKYGEKLGIDLVGNPDLANDPKIAAKIAVMMMLDGMKRNPNADPYTQVARSIGNSNAVTEQRKKDAYARNLETGQFNAEKVADLSFMSKGGKAATQTASTTAPVGTAAAEIPAASVAATPTTGTDGKTMQTAQLGGILYGDMSGYEAMLHGTEAVVPLPDGKSIPVNMPKQNNDSAILVSLLSAKVQKLTLLVDGMSKHMEMSKQLLQLQS